MQKTFSVYTDNPYKLSPLPVSISCIETGNSALMKENGYTWYVFHHFTWFLPVMCAVCVYLCDIFLRCVSPMWHEIKRVLLTWCTNLSNPEEKYFLKENNLIIIWSSGATLFVLELTPVDQGGKHFYRTASPAYPFILR